MIAVSYIMKRKIKKIFLEVISNFKILNIHFFQRNCQRPRFSQTYRGGGLNKGGGLDNVEYGIKWTILVRLNLITKVLKQKVC